MFLMRYIYHRMWVKGLRRALVFAYGACMLCVFFMLTTMASCVNPDDQVVQQEAYFSEKLRGNVRFVLPMRVSAYCSCQQCCSWTLDADSQPVIAAGPLRGKPKVVGRCADGSTVRPGVVAAPAAIPFGTRLYVPGYGECVVADRGGAIRGNRLDVYFPTHQEALNWGIRELEITFLLTPEPR